MDIPPRPLIESAVLVPLFRGPDAAWRMVFIRRSAGGPHGGHIAFPGGKQDPEDRSLRDTALREAREEIGLPPDHVDRIEPLPPMDTRTSGFRIHPFLGLIRRPAAWQPSAREVDAVLEIGLEALTAPDARGETMRQFEGWTRPERVPYIEVEAGRIWGATYRILDALLPRLGGTDWLD